MKSIGVIVSDLYDSYQQTLLNGIKYLCESEGYRLLTYVGGPIGDHGFFKLNRNSLYSTISKDSVDGLVIVSGSLSVTCGLEGLKNFITELPDIPKVSIGISIPGVPSITINNEQGISKIMDHLIDHHKYKNVAFIKGPEANQEAIDRFQAYKDSLEKYNINYNYKLVAPGSFSPGDGIKGINLIMDTRKENFDAIVCSDDFTAIEVIGALKKRGVSIPGDIAVTGFDDLERSGSSTPSLTTVSQPIFNIGRMSIEYLLDLINGTGEISNIVVDTHIQYRESCGCGDAFVISNVSNTLTDEIFIDLIRKRTAEVIDLRNIKFYKKDLVDIIKPLIEEISEGIIESYNVLSIHILEAKISSIYKNNYKKNFKASFWKSVVEDILKPFIGGNNKISLFSSLLLKSCILKLYESEMRVVEYNRIDIRTLIQYINRVGDQLLLCRTESELKKVLRDNLTILRVNNFFVVRYVEGKNLGEVFFSRDLVSGNNQFEGTFKTSDTLPANAGVARDLAYLLYPVIIEGHQVGYVLIEHGNTPTIIYDFLAEKISHGFKNIRIMKQIGSYTEHLEKAVENRTKELKLANVQLQDRSMKDQMTGLRNRRFLDEVIIPKSLQLAKKIKNQVKYGNRAISSENIYFGLIMVDLDHFKEVNDKYGHSSGDTVIKELGKLFSYTVRQEDFVIRLGGEEFLIVLTDFNPSFINTIVEKIRVAVESLKFTMDNGEKISKTCSLGAMAFPTNDPDLIDFKASVAVIDKCLYYAKERGRNCGYVIDVDTSQFKGCKNTGEYIINNFDKCLDDKKITLLKSNKN